MPLPKPTSATAPAILGPEVISLLDAEILSDWVARIHLDQAAFSRDGVLRVVSTGETKEAIGLTPHDPKDSVWIAEIAGVRVSLGACYFQNVYANALAIDGDGWRLMIGDSGMSNGHRRLDGDGEAFRAWYARCRADGTIALPERLRDNPFLIRLIVHHQTQDDRNAILAWLERSAQGPWLVHENPSFPLDSRHWRGVSIALVEMVDERDVTRFLAAQAEISSKIASDRPTGSNLESFSEITLLGAGNLTSPVRNWNGTIFASPDVGSAPPAEHPPSVTN